MTSKFAPEAVSFGTVSLPSFLNHNVGIDESLSNGAAVAKDFMATMLMKSEGINARRQMADPTKTRAGNAQDIERLADKFNEEASSGIKRARNALVSSAQESESKLKVASATPATANAAELRTVLREMKPSARQAALRKAFAEGEKEVIGCVVHGHHLLHGADPEEVAVLHAEYQRRIAPKEHAAAAAHKQFLGWLDKAEMHLMQFGARAYKGTHAYAVKRKAAATILASFDFKFED